MKNLEENFQYDSQNRVFPATAQSVTYTGFDKADKIKQGNDSICYAYGYDHQRIRMVEHVGSTVRTKDYIGMCEYVTETGTSGTKSYTYLNGPYGVFAVIEKQNGVQTPHYVLKDNLGSWNTITDGDGTVEQRLSFDAWGNLRNPNSWSGSFTGTLMFDRGFTGHEHLYSFGLINMNGRMYDPVMSSFLSADRFVQNPLNAQGFNRYAYCMYNPLRFVDPTGWAPRPGGGHGPDDPPPYVVIEGWASGYKLDEVIITSFYEFEYTPYFNTGGGGDLQWGLGDNSLPNSHGSGGGGGNHGGNADNMTTNPNVIVEISSNIDLSPVNVSCFYLNSGNTIIGKGAECASVISSGSKEASLFEKIATHSKILGIIGVGINIGCTTYQMYYGEMPKHEGVVRIGMTGVEFGLTFVPYVGPFLSIGLTAFDIGGGFDDNLYRTENWWKGKQP